MTMDLMYGCGSEYDLTLEELLEVDLRSEMDRIIAAAKQGGPFEITAELEFSSSHFNINEEGMDEIDIRFDASRFDPFSLSSFGLTPMSPNPKNLKSSQNNFCKNPRSNNNNNNNHHISNNNNQNHHSNQNGNSNSSNGNRNNNNNSQNYNNSHSQFQNGKKVNNGITVSSRIFNSVQVNSNNNTSITSNNIIKQEQQQQQQQKPTIVASVGSLNMGGLLEETLGTLVDPSSVVPVSVTNSTASSASESDLDIGEFPTDEDESESELHSSRNTVWVVPSRHHQHGNHNSSNHNRHSSHHRPSNSSRSPSPNDLPEFELDEPEFILTTGSLQEVSPPKKRKQKHEPQPHTDGKIYPKPAFSYSCLIAMALKNSKTGSLPVSEIYKFMCDHFPYFKSAPSGWKNSVRHNLSLNKCFEKIEKPGNGARKGCLWALNPAKIHKMDEEVQKWSRKDPLAIRRAMSDPENLELIERGELKRDYSGNGASDEDDEEDLSEPCTPLTQAQLLARRSRGNSSDSFVGETTTVSSTTPTTKVSQVHAITLNRPIEQKIHVKSEPMDTLDFGTITNVQGNYLCHTGAGTGTYTLSFSPLSNATTPIIIRRTPVK